MKDSFVIYKSLLSIKFLKIIVIFPESPQTFTWGESQNPGGGGGALSVEVIGIICSLETFLENPKKYSDFKALKIPKLLAQCPKKYKFY